MRPEAAVRPPRVDWGPSSTSTLCTPATLFASKESDGTGTPSMVIATPDEMPTVCSFETLEMPRIPVGTRPLMVPLSCTDGTRLFRSDRSAMFALARVRADSTSAATGTSCSFSGRFCAVMTISSSSGAALAAGSLMTGVDAVPAASPNTAQANDSL